MDSRFSENEFEELNKVIERAALEVIQSKGRNYHRNDDVLANFKVNATRLGMTKYQIWAVYFAKHIDAIFNSISDNAEDPNVVATNLKGNIVDSINYLKFLAVMMYEEGYEPFGPRNIATGKLFMRDYKDDEPC